VDQTSVTRHRAIAGWMIGTTLLVEGITLLVRFAAGVVAAEFNRSAPLLLQVLRDLEVLEPKKPFLAS